MYGKRTIANPSYRQRATHHAMLLGGMAAITSALIVVGYKQTYPDIKLRQIEDLKRSVEQVIPSNIHTNDLLEDMTQLTVNNETKDVYVARKNGEVSGVAFEMTTQGYAGPIKVILGINRQGELLGTRILSHNETPGLGDKIEPEKDNWITRFSGLSLDNPGTSQWKVKKDGGYFDQFTGATITPRAVVKAVKAGLEFFNTNKSTLLADTGQPETKIPQQKLDHSDSDKVYSDKVSKSVIRKIATGEQATLQVTTLKAIPNGY